MTKPAEIALTQLSPLGEACSRMDLEAIHKILVKAQYEDDMEVIEVTKITNLTMIMQLIWHQRGLQFLCFFMS